MAKKIKNIENTQIFTPKEIVCLILDKSGFKEGNKNILFKYICEPSFGNGNFLIEIITRLIITYQKYRYTNEEIAGFLNKYVYGFELDKNLYNETKARLNNFLKDKGIIKEDLVFSHLYNIDALSFNDEVVFDFIFANPPYAKIHNIAKNERSKLNNFKDIYCVFITKFLKFLKDKNSIYGLITPNSYFKNTSNLTLRQDLIKHKNIKELINFNSLKVFENASVYCAIAILYKDDINKKNTFKYTSIKDVTEISNLDNFSYNIDFNFANNFNKWCFNDLIVLKKQLASSHFVFKDYDIGYGIATLSDKIFIFNDYQLDEKNDYIIVRNNKTYLIEKALVKDVFKGSKNIYEKIIFPYEKNKQGVFKVIKQDELKIKYPNCYAYFKDFKEQLLTRNLQANTLWYEYGRGQGLNVLNKEKVALNPIFKDKIKSYIVKKDCLVYSSIWITNKENKTDFKNVINVLSSNDFFAYALNNSKDLANDYKNLNTKTIKNYKD